MANHITRKLLRKRAEHNEGIIGSLEEVSLHQEELEGINEVLGKTCKKIKILYLQNNLIPKIENLHHLKDLEYLNLALNNIQKIEGLQKCEFLNKLDLTVNFIDLDELESSISHLQHCHCLRELYMMGNPAESNWSKFSLYVIARLPQLKSLDGTEIIKSMRISACQQLPALEEELRSLADKVRQEKIVKQEQVKKDKHTSSKESESSTKVIRQRGDVVVEELGSDDEADLYEGPVLDDDANNDEEELTENTPEARIEMYREIAEQKRQKEEREAVNRPKERDYEQEQAEAKEKIRKDEEEKGEDVSIRQKNEGGWNFYWDEESTRGCIRLEVCLPRHLDSSLIDVDVHPTYVSIVIKSKLLRLHLPAEVKSSETKCQRSKTTGSLVLTMPKLNIKETTIFSKVEEQKKINEKLDNKRRGTAPKKNKTVLKPKKLSVHEQMLADAAAAKENKTEQSGSVNSKVVDIRNIVPQKKQDEDFSLETVEPGKSGETISLIHEID